MLGELTMSRADMVCVRKANRIYEYAAGSGLSLRSDDFDSVGELHSKDAFSQLVVAVEAAPASPGGLGRLED